jgi:hypothetical protein
VAAFYLDHDVASDVGRLLREAGHDVVTVRELGTTRQGDEQHVLAAMQQGRLLVSLNRNHYMLLHLAWQAWSQAWGSPSRHRGILLLPHALPSLTAAWIGDLLSRRWLLENACYVCDHHGRWAPIT